jgi:hypothetical protein
MSATTEALRAALEALQAAPTLWQAPATQAAIRAALSADEAREPVATRAFRIPEPGTPWWQTAKDCGAWTDRGEGDVGYVHFGSTEALRVYTLKVTQQALQAAHPPSPATQAEQPASERRAIFDRFGVLLGEVRECLDAEANAMHERGLDSSAQSLSGLAHGLGDLIAHLLGHREQPAPAERGEQPAQGLADDDIAELWNEHMMAGENPPRMGGYEHFARAIRAALASAPRVPQGWKLVPVEPTEAMWAAVNKLDNEMAAGSYDGKGCTIEQTWECMLAAAPQPEGGQS